MHKVADILWRCRVWIVLALILAGGVTVRVWEFGDTPLGLNQDEISAAYEAQSLLTYGTDRWGNSWPAYFPSWGSGQNVLYSYLTIPFIAIFGMTTLSVKIVALLLGLATLPLLFFAVRREYGNKTALIATLILALSPWHIMLSRWGLESNILPFFILLGVFLIDRAFRNNSRSIEVVISLVPFAVALYAYGIGFVTIATLMILLFLFCRKQLRERWKTWVSALVVFVIIAFPFGLSLVKSYISKQPLYIERWLPFSIPSLSETRFSQVAGDPIKSNAHVILNGFNDGLIWNSLPGHLPLPLGVLVLACAAIVWRVVLSIRNKKIEANVFHLWLAACIPLFFIIPLNVNQANAVFIPLVVCAAEALMLLTNMLRHKVLKSTVIGLFAVYIILTGASALRVYFSSEYINLSRNNFNPNLSIALPLAYRAANGGALYVTESINLNYIQTLWYLQIPAKRFQEAHPSFTHTDFDTFHFTKESIPANESFTYVIRDSDPPPCARSTIIAHSDRWNIGRCYDK